MMANPQVDSESGVAGESAPIRQRLSAPPEPWSFAETLRTLGLLTAEGLSTGLCLWALFAPSQTLPYAVDNRLSAADRQSVLGAMFGTAALALLLGIAYLSSGRANALQRLRHVASRFAPLMIVGLLPFVFRWRLWSTRELTFGVLAAVLGVLLQSAIRVSLRAGPLFSGSAEYHDWKEALRLRWSHRLRWLPVTIVLLGAAAYSAFFSYHTIANHYNLGSSSYDLGLEDNLLWNLVHGGPFMKMSPLGGPDSVHFGYHATLFAYVIAPFYALSQRAETLLIFQSVMIGFAALPLYLFARRQVGVWLACGLALVYLMYPPVHGSNLYDFHYLPLGVFFLWLTLYLVDAGHFRWAALAVALTLSVREDVAAALVIVGAYLMMSGRRPIAGLIVSLVAGAYFVVMKMIIMPRWLGGDASFIHQYQGLLPAGERGYGGVLKTVIANPVFTLTSLLETEKLLYLVQIGAPLCLFPWRRPIGFLCTLPGFFFTLLATGYLPLIQISFQYTAHWTAFLLIAVVANLSWVRQPGFRGDIEGPTRQRAWFAAIAIMTLITSYQYGAVLQQNTVRGGFGPYKFGTTHDDRERYAKLKTLIAKVPPRAKIVASENIVPHVSNRPDAYTLRVGVFDAEYLLFQLPVVGEERNAARTALATDFGVVKFDEPFVLAKRGHAQDDNAPITRQLR